MDSLTRSMDSPTRPTLAAPATPREAPLAMPAQSLRRFDRAERRAWAAPQLAATPWRERLIVFGGAAALTYYGAREMYGVVAVGEVTPLEWALVVLFVVNFYWIALAFTASLLGFRRLVAKTGRLGPPPQRLEVKTAIVMPIYNEAPSRVFAAMQAICQDVAATGLGDAFDYFFLSDTSDPNIWIAEERALLAMRERLPQQRIYYRRRRKNVSRKAGNVADFVMRWGAAYPQMVVLDADSLMSADAIVRLAAAMEADPDAGIIQSLPLIINRNTLFARVQQFAARIAGPVIAAGLAAWMGRDGNYWGHNAVIRTRAFADHCGLPELAGRPPLGGQILSHDFVEAALMRRAGYAVTMLPTLGGSFEESPPSLIDLAVRDRRWCQGNLQHIRVLAGKGFVLASRHHFLAGIMAYLASPLWMAQLLVGIVLVLQSKYIRPEYFTADFSLFPAWPRFDYERALRLFGLTMAVLLAPKFLGLTVALCDAPTRRGCGGAVRLVLSSLLEIVISAALAPIMMLMQSGAVAQILSGRDTGWNPQRRDDGSIPFSVIVRRHSAHTALGLITLFAAGLISPSLVIWMSPTIAGLILSIPLSWASGQMWIGVGLRRLGLLTTPEETQTPPIVARANALAKELALTGGDDQDALRAVAGDAVFRQRHEMFLPDAGRHRRGEIDVDEAVAIAKLNDARSVEEACAWLKPGEQLAVLSDRALIAMLARLPARAEPLADADAVKALQPMTAPPQAGDQRP
jgi:membrane glycosyltransferase